MTNGNHPKTGGKVKPAPKPVATVPTPKKETKKK